MTPEAVEALFTRSDGTYSFARWGRPIAPVVFGLEEASLPVIKGGVEALATLAGHPMAALDPELGANFLIFFIRDWAELREVPHLDAMIPDLGPLLDRLEAAEANQYRIFRFDAEGGIRACFSFLRMDPHLEAVPAETLALSQAVQAILLWSDKAFQDQSPLARLPGGSTMLRPEVGALVRAAYQPVLPVAAADPSHALRLHARLGLPQ